MCHPLSCVSLDRMTGKDKEPAPVSPDAVRHHVASREKQRQRGPVRRDWDNRFPGGAQVWWVT
ncbi:hypothetical protein TomTYG75_19870 [Sphingobium sp. TomTYG75]